MTTMNVYSKEQIDSKFGSSVDSTPTQNSTNMVTSGGVYNANCLTLAKSSYECANTVTNLIDINLNTWNDNLNRITSIATEDATGLTNSPITSGAFYCTREVLFAGGANDNGREVIVRLTEGYPVTGRIWINMYSPYIGSWSGWKQILPDNTETWTFTLSNGTTVTRTVHIS